jgi:signal-transduction protein with cAMP-binding, CBS, and nucleotidyltransferase domain
MRLRLKHQTDSIISNKEPDNLLNPAGLTEIDQQLIKSYFNTLEELKDKGL